MGLTLVSGKNRVCGVPHTLFLDSSYSSCFWDDQSDGRLSLLVATLGADAVFIQSNAAQGAAVDLVVGLKLGGRSIDAASKGNFGDIQLVL